MLKGFQHFSDTSGLELNKNKTEIYTFRMKEEAEVQIILDVLGFKRGKLPFRYLGMPICHKIISAKECNGLIDKMSARIRIWRFHNLSYHERLVLVNVVLLKDLIFVIPSQVMKEVEKICPAYLWRWSMRNQGVGMWLGVKFALRRMTMLWDSAKSRFGTKQLWADMCGRLMLKKRISGLSG